MEDLLGYKCPCCGGAIEFNSNVQKMKCPYCDTEFEMENLQEFADEHLEEDICVNVGYLLCNDEFLRDLIGCGNETDTDTGREDLGE